MTDEPARVAVHQGDCVAWLRAQEDALFDACVTDPPYHLTSIVKRFGAEGAAPAKPGKTGAYARASKGFMGQSWDGGDVAFQPETWRAIYDRLKPGAHLAAFSGTRTYHRMACAIEEAGFEIRDCLFWAYGSGFPKSLNISKAIDKMNGAARPVVGRERLSNDIRSGGYLDVAHGENRPALERDVTVSASDESRQWEGWGSALKPAVEPICLARKPISEKSVAANVLRWGTGALHIDACRVGESTAGRWPANLVHDGSAEVVGAFPDAPGQIAPTRRDGPGAKTAGIYGTFAQNSESHPRGDAGSAARFFYSAKAGPLDRIGSSHPTVKPVDLMRWLVRMVTPPGGRVLDPFAGSGTTGIACMAESLSATLIDLMPAHVADIERKLAFLRGEGAVAMVEHLRGGRAQEMAPEALGGLFDGVAA